METNENALKPLRNSLMAIIKNIDSGNSEMTSSQIEDILSTINFMSQSNVKI